MDDIHYLIQQQENRKLEFKEKLPAMEKIAITAVAFSNAQGGHLIIGISDGGKLIGVDENNIIQYEEIIANSLYDRCYPSILPEIYSVMLGTNKLS